MARESSSTGSGRHKSQKEGWWWMERGAKVDILGDPRTANISQKNRRSLHRSDLQILQLLKDPSSLWDHIVRITGSRQSTDHKLHQPLSVPPLCLKLIFSSTIAKSLKSIHWPSTTSQLSLHGHQGCSPCLFSKAGVWRGRSSDLACLSLCCVFCIPQPSGCFLRSWSVFCSLLWGEVSMPLPQEAFLVCSQRML